MRLLADRNIETFIISALREAGHDILRAAASYPALTDSELLAEAAAEERVLLTNDKDFADLAFLRGQASAGIVLLHLPAQPVANKAARCAEVLEALGLGCSDSLIVIRHSAWRRRRFRRGSR